MNTLFDIFITNIIDKEDVETRKTIISTNLELTEKEIVDSFNDDEIKNKFYIFKRQITEHYLCIREEDCTKVLAVAMRFNRLIEDEIDKLIIEELDRL